MKPRSSHVQGFVKGEELFSFCYLTSSYSFNLQTKNYLTHFLKLLIGCKMLADKQYSFIYFHMQTKNNLTHLYLLLIGWQIYQWVYDLVWQKEIQRTKSQNDRQNSSPFTNPWSIFKFLLCDHSGNSQICPE